MTSYMVQDISIPYSPHKNVVRGGKELHCREKEKGKKSWCYKGQENERRKQQGTKKEKITFKQKVFSRSTKDDLKRHSDKKEKKKREREEEESDLKS